MANGAPMGATANLMLLADAISSAKGFVCPSRLVAGEEREVEVIVAMTQTRCFHRGFGRLRCAFVALNPVLA